MDNNTTVAGKVNKRRRRKNKKQQQQQPAFMPRGTQGPGPQGPGPIGPGSQGLMGPGPPGFLGPGPQGFLGPGPPGFLGPMPPGFLGPGPQGFLGPGPQGFLGPGHPRGPALPLFSNLGQRPGTPQMQQVFQAPHYQQETMIDLTDDTAPMATAIPATEAAAPGAWKPIGGALLPTPKLTTKATTPKKVDTPSTTAQSSTTPSCHEKWLQFKATLDKKYINITSSQSNKESNKAAQQKKVTKPPPVQKKNPSANINKPKLEMMQGTASQIKLFEQDDKPQMAVDKSPSPIQEKAEQKAIPSPKKEETEKKVVSPSTSVGKAENTQTKQRRRGKIGTVDPFGSYPKGVPKSFIYSQPTGSMGAIQPQDHSSGNIPPLWTVPQLYDSSTNEPLSMVTNSEKASKPVEEKQQYSPSDVYEDGEKKEAEDTETVDETGDPPKKKKKVRQETRAGRDLAEEKEEDQNKEDEDTPQDESPPSEDEGLKRLSAFQRLGPKKKPKLTINLLCSKDQSVRSVVDDTDEEKFTPVHLRKDMMESTNEIILKYLPSWPWKRNVGVRKSVTARPSKSVMILEQEQMEEAYERDSAFIQVSVTGYPPTWRKENVLDVLLENVKGKSFIPCFVEHTAEECKFLVIRSRPALIAIHKLGFLLRKDNVELIVTLAQTDLTLKQLDFIPRLVLRKQLCYDYDGERKLGLKEFTAKSDISHFIYFPLNRITNQAELVQIQSTVAWDYLTDLDLSYNRLTTIDGFDLPNTTPKLKHLDLSGNCFERVTAFLRCRELSLRSLKLEGNPLCHDYTDPRQYVRVVKMIFPALVELDDVKIHLKGEMPTMKRNYSPIDAVDIANKFLETFFPLLEDYEERNRIEDLYDKKAMLTITYRKNLRYSSVHRKFRNIFLRTRVLDEDELDYVEGNTAIVRLMSKWPGLQHDPHTFTCDVMLHTDTSTLLRIDGILKVTTDTLAEDEHVLAFSRTVLLTTKDGIEYKIQNEMLNWDEASPELANIAFQINTVRKRALSLKLDSPPDEDLKKKLVEIFSKITDRNKEISERCLEKKDWNLKSALEFFTKLLKLDDLESLNN